MVPVKREQIEFYLELLGWCGESCGIGLPGRDFLRVRSSVSIADEANFYLKDTFAHASRSVLQGVRLREIANWGS